MFKEKHFVHFHLPVFRRIYYSISKQEGSAHGSAKVCFISCVNDEDQYARAASHIDMLYPPKGVTVEKVAIRHAKSMASGYNEAMEKAMRVTKCICAKIR